MLGGDLDDILEPKAGKSALPDERAGKRFPSSRAKAADDFEPSEGRSEDISLPWEHADLNKQEPREKHGMKVPTATHVLGKQPGWAVTANDPTKGSEFLSGQGANARPEEPVDLEELNLPAAAVASRAAAVAASLLCAAPNLSELTPDTVASLFVAARSTATTAAAAR